MRAAFINTLIELAEIDSRIVLLTGDLGFTVLERYCEKFPDRFYNVGVAEQNMVGIATGLAESGFIPFVYSIATFASMRCYEFIRNGPVLHQFPVRIVGVGGGFEYGSAGATHHALEDIGLMRLQPGLTVLAPADHRQAAEALRKTWSLPGPVYYRIGKDDKATIRGLEGRFELGRTHIVRDGSDLLILTMGSIASEAVAAAEQLAVQGIQSTLAIVSTVNPAPLQDLAALLQRHSHALTVEAHFQSGGLGSMVSEVVAENGIPCLMHHCAVKTTFTSESGDHQYMLRLHGLSHEKIVEAAVQLITEGRQGRGVFR